MSIVAVLSSPRKNGNTSTVVGMLVEELRASGKTVDVFDLNELKDMNGCHACKSCKTTSKCAVNDDIQPILEAIRNAEGLILATPCYFGERSGQMKILNDRFYSFLGADFKPNIEMGKKLSVIASCGAGIEGAKHMVGRIENTLVNMIGFVNVGGILVTNAEDPTTASNDSTIPAKVKEIAKQF